jgi:hypothetical protein
MASDRKFTAIFILYRSGAPSLWDPAFVSMTPSRCLLPDQESLFLRLSPWEPGGVPGVKPCKWGPLSLHNCRPPLGRWEYLSLTEVCTQLLATHPNNNLSAPTSWVILMAFFQTNLERAISMNVPVLCSSVLWWFQEESVISIYPVFFLYRWEWWLLSSFHVGAWCMVFS